MWIPYANNFVKAMHFVPQAATAAPHEAPINEISHLLKLCFTYAVFYQDIKLRRTSLNLAAKTFQNTSWSELNNEISLQISMCFVSAPLSN